MSMTMETLEKWATAARYFGAHMERDATGVEEYRDMAELPAPAEDIVRGIAVLVVLNGLPDEYETPFILELAKYHPALGDRMLGPLDAMLKAAGPVPRNATRTEQEQLARRIAAWPGVDEKALEPLRAAWTDRCHRYATLFFATRSEVRSRLQPHNSKLTPARKSKAKIKRARSGCLILICFGSGLIPIVVQHFV